MPRFSSQGIYQNTHYVVVSVLAVNRLPPLQAWPCQAGCQGQGAAGGMWRQWHRDAEHTGWAPTILCYPWHGQLCAVLQSSWHNPCEVCLFLLLILHVGLCTQGLCPSDHPWPHGFGRDVKGEFCPNPLHGQQHCLPLHPHPCHSPRGNLLFMPWERVSQLLFKSQFGNLAGGLSSQFHFLPPFLLSTKPNRPFQKRLPCHRKGLLCMPVAASIFQDNLYFMYWVLALLEKRKAEITPSPEEHYYAFWKKRRMSCSGAW